CAKGIAVAEV
nr:immunoglobulin heavy chain junction region [Homo sapiens]